MIINQNDFDVYLPPAQSNFVAGTNVVKINKVLVLVGANGTGKTRPGAWMEFHSPQSRSVFRVSAQRSLKMSLSVSTQSLEYAESALIFGYSDAGSAQIGTIEHKVGSKYSGDPYTSLVNDYDKLLVYLFSEDYDSNRKYMDKLRVQKIFIEVPETKLYALKRIWEKVLPQRELILGSGKVEVAPRGQLDNKYAASSMSDGERVVFYLIGQCLSAPQHAIIVIDEPEIHIHRVIQTSLWDAIEAEREDCKFVYITHDLEFAASKSAAKKVWIKGFDGHHWDWAELTEGSAIPEDVLMSVLGSRKPVLFTEGEKGSLDQFFLTHIYDGWTIVPCGGCERVMSTAASFDAMRQFHNIQCKGIIDRDFRTDSVITHLKSRGTMVLELSEIENLMLVEGVIRAVATCLYKEPEVDSLILQSKSLVLADMNQNRLRLVSSIVSFRVESMLKNFNSKTEGEENIKSAIQSTVDGIDVSALWAEVDSEVSRIIDSRDYVAAIKVYNNKGLIHKIAALFGIKGETFQELIKRVIKSKSPEGDRMLASMREYTPSIHI